MAKGKGEGIGRRNNGRRRKMSKNDERSVSGLPKVSFILVIMKTAVAGTSRLLFH